MSVDIIIDRICGLIWRVRMRVNGRHMGMLAVALLGFLGTGCKAVPVMQQRLVSKPNMVFSDSPVFSYQSQVLTQIEPGAALSGGAQAAGCTACR